jgi:uncharacterized membrane protein YccC
MIWDPPQLLTVIGAVVLGVATGLSLYRKERRRATGIGLIALMAVIFALTLSDGKVAWLPAVVAVLCGSVGLGLLLRRTYDTSPDTS